MTDDIHNKERELHLNNKTFQNSDRVSKKDKFAVQKFCDKCFAQGLSDTRVSKYVSNFHTIFRLAPDRFELSEADEDDLETVVARIEKSDYSEATKSDYKTALKKYYKVMEGDPKRDEYPDKVGFFSTQRDSTKIQEADPLSKESIQAIIDECKNDRDRAMYKLLYEGGLRAGELMSLNKEDLNFVAQGVRVSVDGKTGSRTILVVESERYLRNWLNKHPFPDRKKAPLWTKIRNIEGDPEENRLGYDHMRLNLKKLAVEAGVRTYQDGWKRDKDDNLKRDEDGDKIPNIVTDIYPHLLRHSRATHLATELTEAAMNAYFGWVQGSDMPQVYIHLSGKDIDGEIMKLYGIENEEETRKRECPRCLRKYKGNENFCPRCGSPFEASVADSIERVSEAGEKVGEARISDLDEQEIIKRLEMLEAQL